MAPPRWLYKPVGSNDRQVTRAEHGHVLHHSGVWSPDSRWIVYDTRSDAAGDAFDSAEIQAVNATTREVKTLFAAVNGAKCGMASFNPVPHKREIVFTLGPENPTGAWTYAPHRRRGALADCSKALKFKQLRGGTKGPFVSRETDEQTKNERSDNTSKAKTLDARDLLPDADGAFTPGALRGGTAAHTFSPDGLLISAAYEDAVLLRNNELPLYADKHVDKNFRSVAIVALDGKGGVLVDTSEHPRNHSGEGFAVVATRHVGDEDTGARADAALFDAKKHLVARAGDECWVGRRGYRRSAASGGGVAGPRVDVPRGGGHGPERRRRRRRRAEFAGGGKKRT